MWSRSRAINAEGIGTVRALTDEAGEVTDRYLLEAFGTLLSHEGDDPNAYLFAGEPLDPNLGFYYNRARWFEPESGRLASADVFAGVLLDPTSLHRYTFARSSPIDFSDPSGFFTQGFGYQVEAAIQPHYLAEHPGEVVPFGKWASRSPITKPDILNSSRRQFLEIKPLSFRGVLSGSTKILFYSTVLGPLGFAPDVVWEPEGPLIVGGNVPVLVVNVFGVLFYTDRLHLERQLVTVRGFEELFRLLRLERSTGSSRIVSEYVFARQAAAAAVVVGVAFALLIQSMAGLKVSTLGF